MVSSVSPSLKYSCAGSLPNFWNGSTASIVLWPESVGATALLVPRAGFDLLKEGTSFGCGVGIHWCGLGAAGGVPAVCAIAGLNTDATARQRMTEFLTIFIRFLTIGLLAFTFLDHGFEVECFLIAGFALKSLFQHILRFSEM